MNMGKRGIWSPTSEIEPMISKSLSESDTNRTKPSFSETFYLDVDANVYVDISCSSTSCLLVPGLMEV